MLFLLVGETVLQRATHCNKYNILIRNDLKK